MEDNKVNFQDFIKTKKVDFGKRSEDYSEFRPGFPPSFYNKIEQYIQFFLKNNNQNSLEILDLGTGPGTVALELAKKGYKVTGIDISKNQIEVAKKKSIELNLQNYTKFEIASAEETNQEKEKFDIVIAGQCWHWFDHKKTMKEINRILKIGGLFIIAHFCYLPKRSQIAYDTEQLILKYNPTWNMSNFNGIYPYQIDQVIEGNFDFIEQFCYDHQQIFTHESWRGRIRTCNGVGSGILTNEHLQHFDNELQELLQKKYSGEPIYIWHRIWCVISRKFNIL